MDSGVLGCDLKGQITLSDTTLVVPYGVDRHFGTLFVDDVAMLSDRLALVLRVRHVSESGMLSSRDETCQFSA